jgi:hypothetical protein
MGNDGADGRRTGVFSRRVTLACALLCESWSAASPTTITRGRPMRHATTFDIRETGSHVPSPALRRRPMGMERPAFAAQPFAVVGKV